MRVVDLLVQFQTQTEGAVCIREGEGTKDIWIPKSRCEIDPEHPTRGETITLSTDESMAYDKGLI